MADEMQTQKAEKDPMKRWIGHNKGGKGKKKLKTFQGSGGKPKKIDQRMQKIFRKRARAYNSDDESEENSPGHNKGGKGKKKLKTFQGSGGKPKVDQRTQKISRENARNYNSDDESEENSPVKTKRYEHSREKHDSFDGKSSDEKGEQNQSNDENDDKSDDEDGEIEPGITKFTEGCNAFRMAFNKITKKNISDDVLGPVLSDHKKLLAEKLANEVAERKVKSVARKEKHLITEKGHVQPANFLDSQEKFLIGVATKGVVKLFNAVNKAQNTQRGLNPSRTKDAEVLRKKRKEAFFSELGKTSSQAAEIGLRLSGNGDGDGPSWEPLRDTCMLTNHKLKDWDKMQQDSTVADEAGEMSDSSSDDD